MILAGGPILSLVRARACSVPCFSFPLDRILLPSPYSYSPSSYHDETWGSDHALTLVPYTCFSFVVVVVAGWRRSETGYPYPPFPSRLVSCDSHFGRVRTTGCTRVSGSRAYPGLLVFLTTLDSQIHAQSKKEVDCHVIVSASLRLPSHHYVHACSKSQVHGRHMLIQLSLKSESHKRNKRATNNPRRVYFSVRVA